MILMHSLISQIPPAEALFRQSRDSTAWFTEAFFGLVGVTLLIAPLLLLVMIRRSNRTSGTLVLQKFQLATSPKPSPGSIVEISGRLQGIVAFVLSLMGFSPITRFRIAGMEVRCESTSLFGQRLQIIPLRCVQNVSAGVHKPISALILAAATLLLVSYLTVVARSIIPILLGLPVAALFVVAYVLTKRFFIELHSANGPAISLLFKPNVLEGVPIDVEKALSVVSLVRDLVIDQGGAWHASVAAPKMSSPPPIPQLPVAMPLPDSDFPSDLFPADVNFQGNGELAAAELYAEARRLIDSGDRPRAIGRLQKLVQLHPKSPEATKARRTLEKAGVRS